MRKNNNASRGTLGFKLKTGFARSTNLKTDFYEQSSLDHLILSDKFQKNFAKIGKEVIDSHSKSRVHVISGTPGVGKSTFALYLARTLAESKKTRIQSRNPAKNLDSEFLKVLNQTGGERLLPVFLSGDEGEIETAFATALCDSLDRIGMADLAKKMIAVDAKAALSIIQLWEKSYPKRLKELTSLVGKKGGIAEFVTNLKRGRRQALAQFAEAFDEITGGTAHANLKTGVVSQYKFVAKELSAKGFTGVLVVYDEFGKFLERGVRHPSTFDLHFLQEFAEACNSSGKEQLHLLLLSHLPISRYAANLPTSVQQEWAKIEGRFSQLSFNDYQASTYTLIANVFEKGISEIDKKQAAKFSKGVAAWVDGLKKTGAFSALLTTPNLVDTLTACFPMHPSVTALLPLLAEKVAQNERTMFSFLTRNEDHSLPNHIESASCLQDLELLKPFGLYSYFRSLFANDVGVGGASRINIVADQIVNSLEAEDSIGRDVTVCLASIAIINNRSIVKATKKSISGILEGLYPSADVVKKLEELQERRLIVFDRTNDEFSLFEGASVDIKSEIQKLRPKKLTPKAYADILRGNLELSFLTPKRYNFSQGITRYLSEQLVSIEALESKSYGEVDFSKEDGKVVYVAAFSKSEIESAREIAKKDQSQTTVFVIPNRPLDIESDLLELSAIEQLYSKKELLSSGMNVRKELDKYQQIARKAIQRSCAALKSYNNMDATVICGGKMTRKPVKCEFQIGDFVSDVMSEVFNQHPQFNNEMINKRRVSNPIIQGRMRLMAQFQQSNSKNWGIEGNGPELSILKTLLAQNSIKFFRSESGAIERIEFTSSSQLAPLIADFHSLLKKANGPVVMSEVLSRWMAPPFGIRVGLASLYLFLISHVGKTRLSFYHEDTFIPVHDIEMFESILKQPKRYSVQMVEMTPKLASYLKKVISIPRAFIGGIPSDKDADFITVARVFSTFYGGIPEYSRRSQSLTIRQKKLVAALDGFRQPEQFFLKTLPEIYVGGSWEALSDSNIEKIYAGLKEDFDKIQSLYGDLLRNISKSQRTALLRLYRAFGREDIQIPESRAPLADLWRDLANLLPESLKSFAFNSAAGRLIHRATQLEATADNQRVIETLADAITGASPKSWDEKGKTLFDLNLHQSTNEIVQIGLFLSEDGGKKCTYLTSAKDDGMPVTAELVVSNNISAAMEALTVELKRMSNDLTKPEMNKVLIDLLLDLNSEKSRMMDEDEGLPGANWG